MIKKKKVHSPKGRGHRHSKKTTKNNSTDQGEKINLVIQVRGKNEDKVLKIRVPQNTSLGKIKNYLAEKYEMDSDYLYLTKLDPKDKVKNIKKSSESRKSRSFGSKQSSKSQPLQKSKSTQPSNITQKRPTIGSHKKQRSSGKQDTDNVEIIIQTSVGKNDKKTKLKAPRGTKIDTLKKALAKKFELEPDDFELLHVKKNQPSE